MFDVVVGVGIWGVVGGVDYFVYDFGFDGVVLLVFVVVVGRIGVGWCVGYVVYGYCFKNVGWVFVVWDWVWL